jgi:hypothetical protein
MLHRKSTLFAAVALIAVLATVVPASLRFWELISYARQRTIGAELVESLNARRPETVPIQTWRDASGWAITAYHNVCFSEEHVTFDELARFNHDTRIALSGNVNLQSIDWVWARLAKTGPHGQRYVANWEPEYRSLVYREELKGTSQ